MAKTRGGGGGRSRRGSARAARRGRARLRRAPRRRLRAVLAVVVTETPFLRMVLLLVLLWFSFSAALYLSERGVPESSISSLGAALYWGVAAFSTAGIADPPHSGMARLIGGTWIVVGSLVFFGTVVATVTAYFMRPLQRPARQIVETIEYNLEHLDDLSVDELDLLKQTTDSLIEHVEGVKRRQEARADD